MQQVGKEGQEQHHGVYDFIGHIICPISYRDGWVAVSLSMSVYVCVCAAYVCVSFCVCAQLANDPLHEGHASVPDSNRADCSISSPPALSTWLHYAD
jgi:hypothetical protein